MRQPHEIRRLLAKTGFVVEDHGTSIIVTNHGSPKREVCHEYNTWAEVEEYLWLYKNGGKDD